MNLDEALGIALKEIRTGKGLSQETIGASQTFVSDVERGKKSITVGKLEEFALSVGVEPATLLVKAAMIQSPTCSLVDLLEKIRQDLSAHDAPT
jgi:transcriptional regulator with XRE-family HTH domain